MDGGVFGRIGIVRCVINICQYLYGAIIKTLVNEMKRCNPDFEKLSKVNQN